MGSNLTEQYEQILAAGLVDSVIRYIEHKAVPGGFLGAVLRNDLVGAVSHADIRNRRLIPELVMFLLNRVPSSCWGSSEKVSLHLASSTRFRLRDASEPFLGFVYADPDIEELAQIADWLQSDGASE